ncbi:LON peptidase substrate-binding domain-containing protein [Rheinheimera sp. UJ51]|uniref:LON peptidase substrate-binding domain-containing protein n=1 Tax=Rheinheimera sp. UJ51 TaxID=2892446 RepID=UPI001E440B64|nr:LON peptidase substrate-binding domain-containing protein [Rheinheimera sp. UJ51]MCC5452081.1 LON peptidase substrate-binding domain-containing protein [Rheinheimera sp. UJ51]
MSEQLALFPLSSFLLPGGRMKLRVFEPRYVRLVKESLSEKRDFAMATLNPFVSQQHPDRILPLVCKVKIEDFEALPDGLLGITLRGVGRYHIRHRWQESDNLHIAEVEAQADWADTLLPAAQHGFAQSFAELLAEYPLLAELYPEPKLDDGAWLAGRWLELLPMQPALKVSLAQSDPAYCLEQLECWFEHNA